MVELMSHKSSMMDAEDDLPPPPIPLEWDDFNFEEDAEERMQQAFHLLRRYCPHVLCRNINCSGTDCIVLKNRACYACGQDHLVANCPLMRGPHSVFDFVVSKGTACGVCLDYQCRGMYHPSPRHPHALRRRVLGFFLSEGGHNLYNSIKYVYSCRKLMRAFFGGQVYEHMTWIQRVREREARRMLRNERNEDDGQLDDE